VSEGAAPGVRSAGRSRAATVVPAVGIGALALLCWLVTIQLTRGMGVAPGTMGMSFGFFMGMWVAMMAAMMLPSQAPMAMLWTRAIAQSPTVARRTTRTFGFLSGYVMAWAIYGLLAFGLVVALDRFLAGNPGAGRWLAAAIFALAGLYQLTPLKDVCLRTCRTPLGLFLKYGSYRGSAVDFRVGLHHGMYCVGCCWALMVVLIGVGVMNLLAMVVLAAVILAEKLWRYGEVAARVVGVGFLVLAVLAALGIWLPAGLSAPMAPMMSGM
jgi:predicted metal-binding membrane protein